MAEQILDGSGEGNYAKVDGNARLHVHSVSETSSENASNDGRSFNVNSGTINLTTANESALLYIKNNGEFDLDILSIGYLMGNSTGGAGDAYPKVVKNPKSGTLISDAIPADVIENKNAGSSNVLNVDLYKGGEGKTITDGNDFYLSLQSGAARSYVIATGNLVLQKGSSISVSIVPQAGNTSMNIQIFLSIVENRLDS